MKIVPKYKSGLRPQKKTSYFGLSEVKVGYFGYVIVCLFRGMPI